MLLVYLRQSKNAPTQNIQSRKFKRGQGQKGNNPDQNHQAQGPPFISSWGPKPRHLHRNDQNNPALQFCGHPRSKWGKHREWGEKFLYLAARSVAGGDGGGFLRPCCHEAFGKFSRKRCQVSGGVFGRKFENGEDCEEEN